MNSPTYIHPSPFFSLPHIHDLRPPTLHQPHQFPKIRHTKSRHGIPPYRPIPTRIRNDPTTRDPRARLSIDAIAPDGFSRGNIGEPCGTGGVEERVKEAEGGFLGAETDVIEEGDDTGDDRGGGGCSTRLGEGAVDVDGIAVKG